MQLLGAWMMRTPWSRALFKTAFIRGAISTQRRTALRQWCESHMSQTMMAVSFCRQVSVVSFDDQEPAFSTRERFWTVISARAAEDRTRANRMGRRVRMVGGGLGLVGRASACLKSYQFGD